MRTALAGEARDGILDACCTERPLVWMLPAGEGRAVIFDDKLVARACQPSSSAKARA